MKNILIVDDEELFTRSLAEGLVGFDSSLRTYTAVNGQKAVEILASVDVDLVLSDIQMPVMDGFKLLAYMSRRHPQVPVLLMTAFGTEEIRTRLQSAGVDRYFEKPVDFDAIARKISEVLQSSASG